MIDSPVTLNSVWRRGGEILNSNSRFNISTIIMTGPSTYLTTLGISPLSNTMDSGQYSCQSVLLASDDYVLFTDGSQQVAVTVRGMFFISVLLFCKGMAHYYTLFYFRITNSCHHYHWQRKFDCRRKLHSYLQCFCDQ